MTQPIEGEGASAMEATGSLSEAGFEAETAPREESEPRAEAVSELAPAGEALAVAAPAEEVAGDGVGAGDALTDVEIASAVAALVYASPEPISERRLQALLEGPQLERIRAALATLRERLGNSGLPYELRTLAGGYQILTTPDVGEIVQRLAKVRKSERISGAALETLAVVAYRQPVSKAEIEAIRGVQAGPILRTLIERGLVRVSGRSDDPGHPLQYGTTKDFLDRFGLGSLADLPRDGELAKD
ncbi:MAG: SMC-Scp complex subunit ScpB [Planctomycetota bacterium]|nr:SMC-Scp complex subunit ScpB [Planctomycetota bacterium]